MRTALVIVALIVPAIALALPAMQLYRGFWLEHGTIIGTTLNIAQTVPGSWIHRTKATIPAEIGGLNTAG
ncbi:MAG: hypothetical protein DME69_01730 [Verrucomicrobia bacterium]|nr:MAG: hypothetical protein DME69_01730 [Verrucomicrobiota bacterium]